MKFEEKHPEKTRLIGVDWGTTNMRAYRFGEHGEVLDQGEWPLGISSIGKNNFEHALLQVCGTWLKTSRCEVIASGMVGSKNGWLEVPYLQSAPSFREAANALGRVTLSSLPDRKVHIVPGVTITSVDGSRDVMRGEETQIWGADLPPQTVCVLPGTHSKWATVGDAQTITRFTTYVTGELYEIILRHSTLGIGLPLKAPHVHAAFDAGVEKGLRQSKLITHSLFSVRTAGLFKEWEPAHLPSYLSGLLIGNEVASAEATEDLGSRVTILGSNLLSTLYQRALRKAGYESTIHMGCPAAMGLWNIARSAGLTK